jgi:hypothetical protein
VEIEKLMKAAASACFPIYLMRPQFVRRFSFPFRLAGAPVIFPAVELPSAACATIPESKAASLPLTQAALRA